MSERDDIDPSILLEITAEVTAAYVQNNPLAREQLPQLIGEVRNTFGGLGAPVAEPEVVETPAVSVKASVKSDHLVCLCCGLKFKSLKRHLGTAHGLTPDQYRSKWGLPDSYPMVAPEYSKVRSQISLDVGLGKKRT
ncbi:MAG: MucR family transcriptional regulator [Pseudomonadota bacterium]